MAEDGVLIGEVVMQGHVRPAFTVGGVVITLNLNTFKWSIPADQKVIDSFTIDHQFVSQLHAALNDRRPLRRTPESGT